MCNESNPSVRWRRCRRGRAAHIYAGDTYDFYLTNHGRDSLDNAGHDARRRPCTIGAVGLPERVLERIADGLRRRVFPGRRCRRPRVDARRHAVHVELVLLLPVGRHQRIVLRRVRRVHRSDQRPRERRRERALVAGRGRARRRRRDSQHAESSRARQPRQDDELASTTWAPATTAASTSTAASTTRPRI